MNFLAPIQLAWAAASIVVVLLYIHWAVRKTQPTTTLPIWRHAIARRTWWSRWRKLVSVLAACVPILLITLALARPLLSPFVESSRTIVIVVDNTASMNAQPGGQSRLEQAKRAARRLIRNLRTHDRMAILSADSAVRVRCGLTNDRTALHLTLDAVQPTDGTGAMNDGIATARQLVQDEPRPVVVVISDAAFDEATQDKEVVWVSVGRQAENLAITNLTARPSPGAAHSQQVLIEIANFGPEALATKVQWQLNGDSLPSTDVQIPAGETVRRTIAIDVAEPALLIARLDIDDALSADDTARLLISHSPVTRVFLFTDEENSPLERVLRNLSNVNVATSDALPSALGEVDIAVFAGSLPEKLPDVPTLVLNPTKSANLWTVQGESNNPQAAIAPNHPLLHGVDLQDVIIDQIPKLKLHEGGTTLLSSTAGDPLVAWYARPSGDAILLNCGPANSDIQWHDDFPRFIANAVAWLSRDSSPRSAWRTDDTIVSAASSEVNEFVSPYGVKHVGGANLVDAGLWRGADSSFLPVNLSSADESDLRTREAELNRIWPHTSWLPDFGPLWMPLVALALVWLAGQWMLYHREVID